MSPVPSDSDDPRDLEGLYHDLNVRIAVQETHSLAQERRLSSIEEAVKVSNKGIDALLQLLNEHIQNETTQQRNFLVGIMTLLITALGTLIWKIVETKW